MAASDCQEGAGPGGMEGRGKKGLRAVFGLDLRSLALFRICLGVVLSWDLVQRILDAESFYSDFGILPRSVLFSEFADPWDWTLHAFSGQSGAGVLLFAVQLALALCLLAGYRTRQAALLCWLLVVSVQHRNEFVGHGGDQLLRTLLLWSLFLPLGARWSVDSALAAGDRSRFPPWLSVGTAALVLQACFLYWSTLLLKWHPDWWQGRAVGMALESDQFALPAGLLLREVAWLPPLLTWLTMAFEFLGPLLLLLPLPRGWQRLLAAGMMAGLHAGFGICLNLAAFSAASIVFWLAFIPPCFWERLPSAKAPLLRSAGDRVRRLTSGWPRPLSRMAKWMPPSQPLAAPTWRHRAEQWTCALLIAIVAVVTAHRLDVDRGSFFKEDLVTGLREIGLLGTPPGYDPRNPTRQPNWIEWDWYRAFDGPLKALRLKQSWGMFAPSPMIDDGWFVIIGTRLDGTVEELYNRGGFRSGESAAVTGKTWEKPDPVVDAYPSARWRKYLYRLWIEEGSRHRKLFGSYLTRVYDRADKEHFGEAAWSRGKRLLFFEIYYMLERTRPRGGHRPVEKRLIATHRCY